MHFKSPVPTLINLNKSQVTRECLGDKAKAYPSHGVGTEEGDPPSFQSDMSDAVYSTVWWSCVREDLRLSKLN